MQPRCQAKRYRCAVQLGAAAALPSLTPPPRCPEIVYESKLALFSFLSIGQFFGTIRAPTMKSYQKIVPPPHSFFGDRLGLILGCPAFDRYEFSQPLGSYVETCTVSTYFQDPDG